MYSVGARAKKNIKPTLYHTGEEDEKNKENEKKKKRKYKRAIMFSYLRSFLWKTEEQSLSTIETNLSAFEMNLQAQKTKLRKCTQPCLARNLPRCYTLKQVPKQELGEILSIKLRKTVPVTRQSHFGPRHPVLQQLIETVKRKNTAEFTV